MTADSMLVREAREFALAYEVVSPKYQQQFAKDAVAMIRKLAAALEDRSR